jgi:hypothetical protein
MRAPFLAVMLLGCATTLTAQRMPLSQPLDSGVVVRLRLGAGTRETGRLVTPFAPDSSVFRYCRWPPGSCAVGDAQYTERPASSVLALEVRLGSRARAGAVVGTVFGVLVGGFVASGGVETETGSINRLRGLPLVLSAVGSVIAVGAFGALIGDGFSRWEVAK